VIEHGLLIEPVLGIKTVIGRPILLMPVLGAQEGADGMTAKAGQMRQEMAASPLKTLPAGKGSSTGPDEIF
jgi:hypothetical protein